jgi:hypothetical protein
VPEIRFASTALSERSKGGTMRANRRSGFVGVLLASVLASVASEAAQAAAPFTAERAGKLIAELGPQKAA